MANSSQVTSPSRVPYCRHTFPQSARYPHTVKLLHRESRSKNGWIHTLLIQNYFFSLASLGLKNDVILAIPLVFTFFSASTPRLPGCAFRFVAPEAVFFSLTIGAAAAAAAAARSARYAFSGRRLRVSSVPLDSELVETYSYESVRSDTTDVGRYAASVSMAAFVFAPACQL